MINVNSKSTVGDLIEALKKFDQDKQIGLSSDGEGNSYSSYIYPEEHNNLVILYPSSKQDIDEFEDYESDEDNE